MYKKNAWKKYLPDSINLVMDFNEGYKDYISKGKTERLVTSLSVELAKKHGFKQGGKLNYLNYINS